MLQDELKDLKATHEVREEDHHNQQQQQLQQEVSHLEEVVGIPVEGRSEQALQRVQDLKDIDNAHKTALEHFETRVNATVGQLGKCINQLQEHMTADKYKVINLESCIKTLVAGSGENKDLNCSCMAKLHAAATMASHEVSLIDKEIADLSEALKQLGDGDCDDDDAPPSPLVPGYKPTSDDTHDQGGQPLGTPTSTTTPSSPDTSDANGVENKQNQNHHHHDHDDDETAITATTITTTSSCCGGHVEEEDDKKDKMMMGGGSDSSSSAKGMMMASSPPRDDGDSSSSISDGTENKAAQGGAAATRRKRVTFDLPAATNNKSHNHNHHKPQQPPTNHSEKHQQHEDEGEGVVVVAVQRRKEEELTIRARLDYLIAKRAQAQAIVGQRPINEGVLRRVIEAIHDSVNEALAHQQLGGIPTRGQGS